MPTTTSTYVMDFADICLRDLPSVGGKNASLGEMFRTLKPKGVGVLDGFATSLANRGAYRIDDETGQLWVVSDKGTPRKGALVTVKGPIREGFNLGSLGDQIKLPGIGVGLVLMESSHRAK